MKRTPLARKTPLKAKRSTPRRTNRDGIAYCIVRGCDASRSYVVVTEGERYCKAHGKKAADHEARTWVRARDPICVANPAHAHLGVQWAHVWSRGHPYIRLDAMNAVGLCQGCHFAYTKNPANWYRWVEFTRPGLLMTLLHRDVYGTAIRGEVDLAEVIRTYRRGEPWHAEDPPEGWLETRGTVSA